MSMSKYLCSSQHFSCLNAVRINFISGSSQFDGDMIPHVITFGCFERVPRSESSITADQEGTVRVVLSEVWMLVADKVTCSCALRSFLAVLFP